MYVSNGDVSSWVFLSKTTRKILLTLSKFPGSRRTCAGSRLEYHSNSENLLAYWPDGDEEEDEEDVSAVMTDLTVSG